MKYDDLEKLYWDIYSKHVGKYTLNSKLMEENRQFQKYKIDVLNINLDEDYIKLTRYVGKNDKVGLFFTKDVYVDIMDFIELSNPESNDYFLKNINTDSYYYFLNDGVEKFKTQLDSIGESVVKIIKYVKREDVFDAYYIDNYQIYIKDSVLIDDKQN